PSNLASGSLVNCTTYYTVGTHSCICSSIEAKLDITAADSIAWNLFFTSSCAIQIVENLCVSGTPATGTPTAPPSNITPGTLTNCTHYYTIASGDIENKFGLALADLLRRNSARTSSCTIIGLGDAYCVAGGGDPCSKIYTVISGDSCGSIEEQFGITLADIIAWNPFLTSSCAIQIGENVCVSGAPTGTPSGPPPNIAAGTLKNCTTHHTVVSGDSCGAIETKLGTTLNDIIAWNLFSFLTSACAIEIGDKLCVNKLNKSNDQ
ncbi:hypothetical protein DFH06DRAFT_1019244, partial [Mycena polygramma]